MFTSNFPKGFQALVRRQFHFVVVFNVVNLEQRLQNGARGGDSSWRIRLYMGQRQVKLFIDLA